MSIADRIVTGVFHDSRRVIPDSLFVCTPGTTSDSHLYLAAASRAGAIAAIVHSEDGKQLAESVGLIAVTEPDSRREFNSAVLDYANRVYDNPANSMMIVGATGTNGKTTTCFLIRELLSQLDCPAAYLGTLGYERPGRTVELSNTTPFPSDFVELLADARDNGVKAFAAEVSSHALAEARVPIAAFDVAVMTNLTQDHLDFHGTMEDYEQAKFELFSARPPGSLSVINIDDASGRGFVERLGGASRESCLTFGAQGLLQAGSPRVGVDSLEFSMALDGREFPVKAPLGGAFNVQNLLAAMGSVVMLGFFPSMVARAASRVRPVPGRFEPVRNRCGFGVIVDYAHTHDALNHVLDAARSLTNGRIITVFGCGGDRDRTKRARMARAASERSELTIVTSDNPRTEEPEAIIEEVLAGIVPGREYLTIPDRGAAIQRAISLAKTGDVVVLAGKGHEEYQIVGTTKLPFSDREQALAALEARACG